MKHFALEDNAIVVDTTLPVNYSHLLGNKEFNEVRDLFFAALSHFSGSTEMITTWLGRNPAGGGMVIVPWNTLATLTNYLLADAYELWVPPAKQPRHHKLNALYVAVKWVAQAIRRLWRPR